MPRVLPLGDFSLHEQGKVTRSPKASGSFALWQVARSVAGRVQAWLLQVARSRDASETARGCGQNRQRRWVPALLWLAGLIAIGAHAQTDDAQRTAEETQARHKLEQVRADIRKLVEDQKQTAAQRNDVTIQLREQELKIAATAKALRGLDQQLAEQQGKLDGLLKQREALDAKLKGQRDALAALLRSAYAMGRDEELKLLLAQDSIDDISRMLAYYRYFERARVHEIGGLLQDLDALAQVQAQIERQTADLTQSHEERSAQAQQLEAERDGRRRALGELEATLKNQTGRLAALGKDEKALVDLLAKLHDIFADIPKHLAGAEPFADLRGRLKWPLRGPIVEHFGSAVEGARSSQGLLIAAKDGSEVHAVSHGRVVYADWLRGYGLLLIIDHGEGYLSLYGYNETLLKDVGDWADANEVVATSGDSGGRKSPGLYFELRHDGKAVDPRAWLGSSSR
jgi:septal ring factor EnvC (AmiA/AmiB activator)